MNGIPQIKILDSLRAFAAVSVCMFHFVCTITGFIQNESILSVFSIGQYGVQMFFVISGFVIPWAMFHSNYELKNFFSFFLKRISRLEPPYLFSILLALSILYLRERFFGEANNHIQISLKQVAFHLGYLIPFFENYHWLNQVYWTLAIEFQYYLFIAILFIPLVKSNRLTRILIYITVAFLSFFGKESFLPHWLPLFFLGILLFLYKSNVIEKDEYYYSSLILVILSFYFYSISALLYAITPIIAVMFWPELKIKGLHFLGKFSYSIYLIHPLLGASFINVLSHRFLSPFEKFVIILAGTIITLISSWLMYRFIEKPSKLLSSSIKY
jgi:peptidoglycan/LPS O-acetylase OafA/YrhL